MLNANIIRISKDNINDKQPIYNIPYNSSMKFGLGYLYVNGDKIYYFNASTYTLYLFHNDIEQHIDSVTSVVIDNDYIYYADKNQCIYACDINLTNKKKIWSIEKLTQVGKKKWWTVGETEEILKRKILSKEELAQIADDNFKTWCYVNLTGIAEIQQMSIHNDRLFFTISNTAETPTRVLFSIKKNGVGFQHYRDFLVKSYQWYDDKLCIFGKKTNSATSSDEVFEYSEEGNIFDLGVKKRYILLCDDYCYYWDDENECKSLIRMNLLTSNIELIS